VIMPTPATDPGDANLDGEVDVVDLAVLANHMGSVGADWVDGDFNGDMAVDVQDLATLANNFGAGGGAGPAPVPEPATILLLAVGGVAALRRKGRRRSDRRTWESNRWQWQRRP